MSAGTIAIVSAGSFAASVIELMCRQLPSLIICNFDEYGAMLEQSPLTLNTAIVIGSQASAPSFTRAISLAAVHKQVCIPVMLLPTALQIGPTSRPDAPGCWLCGWMRVRLSFASDLTSIARDKSPQINMPANEGYLQAFAVIATERILSYINAFNAPPPGNIWRYHLYSGVIQSGRIIPLNSCSICSSALPAAHLSSPRLRAELAL